MAPSALIVVDVQNDFISGTMSLNQFPGCNDAEQVVPAINRLLYELSFDLVVYSQDWHPENHCSFILSKGRDFINKWPVHCVQNSWGADFAPDLCLSSEKILNKLVVRKGTDASTDCYSAFGIMDGARAQQTKLKTNLIQNKIKNVFVCGLAFDVCVAHTAFDAAKCMFNTYIVQDCCRSVYPQDSPQMAKTKAELEAYKVKLISSDELINSFLLFSQ